MKSSLKPLWEQEENTVFYRVMCILMVVLLLVCGALAWFQNRYIRIYVSGNSMYATLESGNVLHADPQKTPVHGDIIVLDVRDNEAFQGEYIIKRLIGDEGDSLYCTQNTVYIRYAGTAEYVPLDEPYLYEPQKNASFPAVEVGEGQVFVMGDNRSVSKDSRADGIGCLPKDKIVGVITPWSVEHRKGLTNFWNFMGNLIKIIKTQETEGCVQ